MCVRVWPFFIADARIGQYYGRYMSPYLGTYGAGSANGVNRFWAIAGNHDVSCSIDLPGLLTLCQAY